MDLTNQGLFFAAGGQPLYRGGKFYGAIGIFGGNSTTDADLAACVAFQFSNLSNPFTTPNVTTPTPILLGHAIYAVQKFIDNCVTAGNSSVAIIDYTGFLKYAVRADFVYSFTAIDQAIGKAEFAFDYGLNNTLGDTDPVASQFRPGGSLGNIDRTRSWFNNQPYINIGGGRAIFYQGVIIGAVGVTTPLTTPAQDDESAQYIINAIIEAFSLPSKELPSYLNLTTPYPQPDGTFSLWRANDMATICLPETLVRILNGEISPICGTLAIVDAYSKLKLLARMDNATLNTVDTAIWKARTAAVFGGVYLNPANNLNSQPSASFVAPPKEDYGLQYGDKGYLFLPGGVPFFSTTTMFSLATQDVGMLVGGIGFSGDGLLGQQDDESVACLAQYALADLILGHQNSGYNIIINLFLIFATIAAYLIL